MTNLLTSENDLISYYLSCALPINITNSFSVYSSALKLASHASHNKSIVLLRRFFDASMSQISVDVTIDKFNISPEHCSIAPYSLPLDTMKYNSTRSNPIEPKSHSHAIKD